MNARPPIYLGTILLEVNRWNRADRRPSFRVSDWARRIADDGFDGLELWENHALLVDDDERDRLRTGPCPVTIFNAYDTCETETLDARRRIAEVAKSLGAGGLKYNTGKDPARHEEYVANLKQWRGMFSPAFRFLCECHRGSTMADPALASRTLDELGRAEHGVILHGFGGDEAEVRERFGHCGDRITHLHCNLSAQGPMTPDAVRRRLELLRGLGFDGTYTIEFTEGVRDGLTIEELYRHAVRDLRLLRDGLKALA